MLLCYVSCMRETEEPNVFNCEFLASTHPHKSTISHSLSLATVASCRSAIMGLNCAFQLMRLIGGFCYFQGHDMLNTLWHKSITVRRRLQENTFGFCCNWEEVRMWSSVMISTVNLIIPFMMILINCTVISMFGTATIKKMILFCLLESFSKWRVPKTCWLGKNVWCTDKVT